MYKKRHKFLQRKANSNKNEYNSPRKPTENDIKRLEKLYEKEAEYIDKEYELWFGRYKGHKLWEVVDDSYLFWLGQTFKKSNKKLAINALARMREIK